MDHLTSQSCSPRGAFQGTNRSAKAAQWRAIDMVVRRSNFLRNLPSRSIQFHLSASRHVIVSLGIASPLAPQQILKGANQNGTHKSSMLQDLERGRPLEIDALSGAAKPNVRI